MGIDNIKALKISLICALSFGAIFGLTSIVFYFGDWERLVVVFMIGIFTGLLATPEFEPKAFNNPRLFQSISGFFCALFGGILLNLSIEGIIIISVTGAVLGYFSKYWIKHINIP